MADEEKSKQPQKIRLRRPGAGRKTKLTPELIEEVSNLIAAGCYAETACLAAGIHRSTMHDWLKRGAAATKGLYRLFTDAIKEAGAIAEVSDTTAIMRAAQAGNWKAAAWRIERRAPLIWGRRETVQLQHTGADGGPIQIEERRKALIAIASNPETRALIEQLAKAMAPLRNKITPTEESIDVEFGLAKGSDVG